MKFLFLPFLKEGETSISGDEMLKRASKMEGREATQEDIEYLLEHPELIPEKYNPWNGGRYFRNFSFPNNRWDENDIIVRVIDEEERVEKLYDIYLRWDGKHWKELQCETCQCETWVFNFCPECGKKLK